jgi:hypothetical protein
MRPIKTPYTPDVYKGNGEEVMDLPCKIERRADGSQMGVWSVWEPDEDERKSLAEGGSVLLGVFTPEALPPVYVGITEDKEAIE